MSRSLLLSFLLLLAISLAGCSGGSSIPAQPLPNVSGSWEFIAASNTNPGFSTGIEVALKEGQVFADGNYAENGEISASGQQISFIGFTPGTGQNSPPTIVFGGNCAPATENPGNNLSGSISGVGGSMNFTYTENGNVFNVTAILDASGQSLDSGTYTEQLAQAGQSNGACNGNASTIIDTGSVTGKIVAKLSGTYSGQLCQPQDTSCANTQDAATATLSQSGTTLTVNVLLTGADNTSFTLAGPVTGNAFSVQGTFQGQAISYNGYYELTYDSATGTNDIPAVYLNNAACNAPTPQTCGNLLTVPPTP
jgi:hypothetical protein